MQRSGGEALRKIDPSVDREREMIAALRSVGARAGPSCRCRPACKGTVSADPKVLPLGSKIRVSKIYSGEYTVVDTARKVDIHVSSVREAREFGKKQLEVEILGSPAHD